VVGFLVVSKGKLTVAISGHVSFEEWSSYMNALAHAKAKGPLSEEDIEHIFRLFDKYGYIRHCN
jgi:hypothetical protein